MLADRLKLNDVLKKYLLCHNEGRFLCPSKVVRLCDYPLLKRVVSLADSGWWLTPS